MKYPMMMLAIVSAAFCGTAFAQTSTPANADSSTTVAAMSAPASTPAASSALAQAGQWVPPYGQPIAGKTRAQVYQELVQAEQDGQLAYLNSTLYAH